MAEAFVARRAVVVAEVIVRGGSLRRDVRGDVLGADVGLLGNWAAVLLGRSTSSFGPVSRLPDAMLQNVLIEEVL